MNRQLLRVVWFRFQATFRARRGGLLVLVLLIGLVGGVAVGAIAGARRTQSSYPRYLASTRSSDLDVGTAIFNPDIGSNVGYDPAIVAKIARLPHVKQIKTVTGFNPEIVALRPLHTHFRAGEAPPGLIGSADGEFATQDRVVVTQGRLANPHRVDEAVLSAGAARVAGLHVGSVVPLGIFTNAQAVLPDCCSATGTVKPHRQVDLKVVGIVLFNNEVVQDDVDALGADTVLFTPAFTREFRDCCAYFSQSALQLERGSRDVAAVKTELARLDIGRFGNFSAGSAPSLVEAQAERAIKPQAIALGVFGAIAALAALLIAGQVIGRQLRSGTADLAVVRALGASTAMTTSDGLIGILGAVVFGSLLAVGVAVGVSPLAPIGPVRPVDPSPGIAFDWTVLGGGLVVLIGALSAIAIVIAWRQAPHRVARRRDEVIARVSPLARAAAGSGMPVAAATGIRFALEPGRGRAAVPVRSVIVAAVLAVVVVIGALTFGASLNTLVSRPALYGWNWHYELLAGYAGQEDLPEHKTATLLNHDHSIAAWTGVYFSSLLIDGRPVPVIGGSPNAKVGPPLLSGHSFAAPDQVVLGATTLADLHKRVGDTVEAKYGSTKPTRLHIVGTATMPTIGQPGGAHLTMGTGALLSYQLIPPEIRNIQTSPVPGPNAILVRFRDGADPKAALRSLDQINTILSTGPNASGGGVVSVLRPAEIVNYRSMGTTPATLGAALAAGAVTALALTLVASVRRRRRDFALLKTLGFTYRQLGAVVAWQSSVAVGIGVIAGVPIGIVLGRWLWDLFAHTIHAVPEPTIPTLSIALVIIGALVLANIVAAIPARQAARTPTALLLREE